MSIIDRIKDLVGPGSACEHMSIGDDPPAGTEGCEECLAEGTSWVHLRKCLTCGHVGCCQQSKGKHAQAHFDATEHAVMRSHEPDETWRYCYVDQTWD